MGLVMGVVIGGLMHFAIQIPYVQSFGLIPRIRFNIDMSVVKNIFIHSIPRTITLSASQIELIFLTSYASYLTIGSIAIFNFATNLQSVPFSIVAVSYALAAFPTLSGYFAKGETQKFVDHVVLAARHIIFWSVPITVLFIVLRAQIVRTILGSGSFNWEHTRLTAACVAMFIVSLVAQGLEILFVRAYYAAGKTRRPLIVNVISSIITISLPFFLLQLFNGSEMFRYFIESLFKIEGINGSGIIMLPLGFTLGTIINALIFWYMFQKEFGNFTARVMPSFFSSLQAGILGGFAAYLTLNILDDYLNLNTLPGIFLQGLGGAIVGLVITVCTFVVLRNEEIAEVWHSFHQKLGFTSRVVVSEPENIEM
jgi:putative peptidoglycan lipid II flippase